ncbi:MAG: adenine phosphoribosyltransferase [Halobacteriovoraceae bacterium]|nr:adenine phosphoribosyltransferase [Halobacteriovoraceae bacterium]|tara:strand:- start:9084 stop:9593 length:510 start_codon:yes stop_codon:yes gene_type:complete
MNQSEYEELIHNVADFPKPGVVFKDMSPLLSEKLSEVVSDMGREINWNEIDLIVGIESRGFILGSAMAIKYGKGFLPMRKKGKLPPPVIGEEYELEYGTDKLEMRVNDKIKRVCLVDDVLATGGTLKAGLSLCEKNKFEVKAISVLIDLQFLNELAASDQRIHSVLQYK